MNKVWWIALIPGMVVVMAVVFVVALLAIRALWAWTVPDLFPGAVATGLIKQDITWVAAFKLALFIAVMAGIIRGAVGRSGG